MAPWSGLGFASPEGGGFRRGSHRVGCGESCIGFRRNRSEARDIVRWLNEAYCNLWRLPQGPPRKGGLRGIMKNSKNSQVFMCYCCRWFLEMKFDTDLGYLLMDVTSEPPVVAEPSGFQGLLLRLLSVLLVIKGRLLGTHVDSIESLEELSEPIAGHGDLLLPFRV